jgi:hypothetical protein
MAAPVGDRGNVHETVETFEIVDPVDTFETSHYHKYCDLVAFTNTNNTDPIYVFRSDNLVVYNV